MSQPSPNELQVHYQSFLWASLDVHSATVSILVAIYFAITLTKLVYTLDDPTYKHFKNSIVWSIISMIASIFVSIAQISRKLSVFVLNQDIIANLSQCDQNFCLYCEICHRISTMSWVVRNFCLLMVFIETIDSHFEFKLDGKRVGGKAYKIIKIILIVCTLIVLVLLGLFAKAQLFRLQNSNHIICSRHSNPSSVYMCACIVFSCLTSILLVATIVGFVKHSHVVKFVFICLHTHLFQTYTKILLSIVSTCT